MIFVNRRTVSLGRDTRPAQRGRGTHHTAGRDVVATDLPRGGHAAVFRGQDLIDGGVVE